MALTMDMADYVALEEDTVDPKRHDKTEVWTATLRMGKEISTQILPVCLGVFFGVLDNLPYSILFIPHELEHMTPAVATMVMNSVIIMQLSFAFSSQFVYGAGACAIESAPFMAGLASSIAAHLTLKDRIESIPSTILVAFLLTSVSVSCAMFLLARFRLGRSVHFFPKHVLIGTVGGVGVFISFAAVGLATGSAWQWKLDSISSQFEADRLHRLLVVIALEAFVLLSARRFPNSTFLVPCMLMGIAGGFYIVLWSLGISMGTARNAGWLFNLIDPTITPTAATDVASSTAWLSRINHSFNPYRHISWSLIDFDSIAAHLLNFIAVTFFIVLQPCINIPALALQHNKSFSGSVQQSHQPGSKKRLTSPPSIDADKELELHARANFLSFISGGLPGYMTFSSTTFLRACNLKYRKTSAAIALSIFGIVLAGPTSVINQLPRVVAGLFVLHLGGIIAKDAFIDSLTEFDAYEYITVVVIAVTMQYDFVAGVFFGLMIAMILFTARVARHGVVSIVRAGRGLHSRQLRTIEESRLLDQLLNDHVAVINLDGDLFFGNAQQFLDQVQYILTSSFIVHPSFLLVDFSRVRSLDCTGVDKLASVVRLTKDYGAGLLCSGMSEDVMLRASCWCNVTTHTRSNAYHPPNPLLPDLQTSFRRRSSDFLLPTDSTVVASPNDLLVHKGNRRDSATRSSSSKVRFFQDLDSALCWCEVHLLAFYRSGSPQSSVIIPNGLYLDKDQSGTPQAISNTSRSNESQIVYGSPSASNLSCDSSVTESFYNTTDESEPTSTYAERPPLQASPVTAVPSTTLLTNLLRLHIPRRASRKALRLAAHDHPLEYFQRETLEPGALLWRQGTRSESMIIVERGVLAVPQPDLELAITDTLGPQSRRSASWHRSAAAIRTLIHSLPQKRIVVDHPIWDSAIAIHRGPFVEFIDAGQIAGGLSFFCESWHRHSLVAVEETDIWRLTRKSLRRMERTCPQLLCLVQQLVLREAYLNVRTSDRSQGVESEEEEEDLESASDGEDQH